METEPTIAPDATPPPIPAKAPAEEAAPSAPVSPWEDYLTGKKTAAASFLAKMEKDAVTVPNDATRNRFAEALAAKPERVERLMLLLQASADSAIPARRIVVELAELGIKRLGVVAFPEPLNAAAFTQAIVSWLGGISERPLKSANLDLLFLLLHVGRHRQLLDQDAVLHLVASAIAKPAKARPTQAQPAKPAPTPLDIVLAAGPTEPFLSSMMAYFDVSKAATEKRNAQIQAQMADITRLTAECASLTATITALRADLDSLKAQKAAAETTIVDLEKQIVDIHNGYQYKLNELRGRIRGMLQGQLTRWLQTAFDASQSDPPWIVAIQERLEDALLYIRDLLAVPGPEKDMRLEITKVELEEAVRDLIANGLSKIEAVLNRAGIHRGAIEFCLATGGMVSMPAIREGLRKIFGMNRLRLVENAATVISEGAAWIAHDGVGLQLVKPIELLHADNSYVELIPAGTNLPLDGNAIQHRMDMYCVNPSDGFAKFLFARPTWPGRESHGNKREPYAHLTLPVDARSRPLFERLQVEVTIDHDLIADIRAFSLMRGQTQHAQIHDLEFGLSVKGVVHGT